MIKVAIIHPWMPQYRVEFFKELIARLASYGIEVHIYYGQTPPEWQDRGDSRKPLFATELPTKFFQIGRRNLSLKSTARLHDHKYELIIIEQAIRNIESYILFLRPRYRSRIAMWGHGRTYTQAKSSIEERLKQMLTRQTRWFFAYTDEGRATVVSEGYDSKRTSVVQNSIDTKTLSESLAALQPRTIEEFSARHDLTAGLTAIYLGGLDVSKRLDTILRTASMVHDREPDFRLLIGGDGAQADQIREFARSHAWAIYLGRVEGPEKAVALSVSDFMLNPGRVGLVAVDSIVTSTPIVTTNWPYHAPEFEYLTHGVTTHVCDDTDNAIVAAVISLMKDPEYLATLKLQCASLASTFSIESMVERFSNGVLGALGTDTSGTANRKHQLRER